MTTAASASLAHDQIVIGYDFSLAVIIEPIAGQSAADVVTAMGTGASATAHIVDTDAAETVIASLTAGTTIVAATRTLTITLDADSSLTLLAGLSGVYAWRIALTTSTGTGGLRWPVRMPRRVSVSRRAA